MYILIIGCGTVGRSLAEEIATGSSNVVVVDKSAKALGLLGERFNGINILGDALNLNVLEDAGIAKADVVFAVTRDDNLNLVVAEVAKELYKVKKVVAMVEATEKAVLFEKRGIECVSRTKTFVNVFKQCI